MPVNTAAAANKSSRPRSLRRRSKRVPFGASVLAWIVSAKFERHLPTYRHQEMLLEPLGMWLSRPLLCQLLKGCARALKPLAERLLKEILLSYVVQADETPVRYLGGAPGKASFGYLFGYGGDADHRYLWYDFRQRRNRDGPREVLGDFRGVLQTDGFSAYESLVTDSQGRLTAAACWMHARRGFDEARYTTSQAIVEETLGALACSTTWKIVPRLSPRPPNESTSLPAMIA